MINKQIRNIFFAAAMPVFLFSCKSSDLPKVQNPTYESYSINGERGYFVKFSLPANSKTPTAVVLNHIEQPVNPDAVVNGEYTVNVIAQTRKILNYKVKRSDKEDGLIFITAKGSEFLPVTFKLVSK